MRRSEMSVKLQRLYYIRHVMVETSNLSVKDFINEILICIEEAGMEPPKVWGSIPTLETTEVDVDKGLVNFTTSETWGLVNKWESENESI